MSKQINDQAIIAAIRSGGPTAERALSQVYDQNRTMVMKFIRDNNGNTEEGKDMLQDAVIIFYERARESSFTLTSKISTYLYSIVRFTWLNKLKRQQTEKHIVDSQEYETMSEGQLPVILRDEQARQVTELFDSLGQDCSKILTWSIYDNYSNQEICDRMHFQNAQVVRNKKSKCLKSLRALIAQRPAIAQLINEMRYGS